MSENRYRTIIIASTALLSVFAAILTLLLFEARRTERYRAAGGRESVDLINNYTDSGGHYYSFAVTETNYSDTAAERPQTQPPAQTSAQPRPRAPLPPASTQPFNPQSLQNTTQTSPSSPSGLPYMIDNASPDIAYFALTFDGGSIANAAGDIFDTLASRGVKSTIFLTGDFIRRFPQVVIRAVGEGHEIGNHTHRHQHLTTYAENGRQSTRPEVTRQFITNELVGAARILADRTGLRFAPFWRAPYGEYNNQICLWAFEAGYIHIGWRQGGSWSRNLDTNDWVPNEETPGYRSPLEVYDKIVRIAAQPGGLNGGIILMHLGTERKVRSEQVHIILGRLIDTLRSMGYEPVTVSELLHRSGVNLNAAAVQGE